MNEKTIIAVFVFCCAQVLDPTAQALEACEKWVLGPYRGVLKAVSLLCVSL